MYVGRFNPNSEVPNLEPVDFEALKARRSFLVPPGTKNVALGKPVTSSDSVRVVGSLALITDDEKQESSINDVDNSLVELAPGLQWVQIDLGESCRIWKVLLWHSLRIAAYLDVVVQVSDDPQFQKGVTTIFNNDHDNSSGLGKGSDPAYIENSFGRLIEGNGVRGRYVRFYSHGNTGDDLNHYLEASVYGVQERGAEPAGSALPSSGAAKKEPE